jgi:hypothetical protein
LFSVKKYRHLKTKVELLWQWRALRRDLGEAGGGTRAETAEQNLASSLPIGLSESDFSNQEPGEMLAAHWH